MHTCIVRHCQGSVRDVYHGTQHETGIPFTVGRCTARPDLHRYFLINGAVPSATNRVARPHWGWGKDSVINRTEGNYGHL